MDTGTMQASDALFSLFNFRRESKDSEFKVLQYKETIPNGYSIPTCAFVLAEQNHGKVMETYNKYFRGDHNNAEPKNVRLKNGFLTSSDTSGEVKVGYQDRIGHKLVSKSKPAGELENEDQRLIALAYAAEHDDVQEVEELVPLKDKRKLLLLRQNMPFASLGTILHHCVQWGSLATIEHFLKTKDQVFNVYGIDKYGDTALHNLPNNVPFPKSPEFCERAAGLLLRIDGAHANTLLAVCNNYGHMTALCKALAYEKKYVCEALLEVARKNEEYQLQVKKPATAAAQAAWRATQDLPRVAEVAGPTAMPVQDLAGQLSDHWLTLRAHGWMIAAAYGLGEKGFDLQTGKYINKPYCTALHLAVLRQYSDVVHRILTYPGAPPSLSTLFDHDRNTPLHVAARIGKVDICSTLLKHDAGGQSVNSQNEEGETPLHVAATHGHADVCALLLEYGTVPLLQPDKYDRYPLTNALYWAHTEAVKKLLDACIPPKNPAATTSTSAPPAGYSSDQMHFNPNPKEALLNQRFASGLTPLHVAVAISSESHIENLIKAGAWVNLQNSDGRTPLHVAAQQHDLKSLRMLLEAQHIRDADKKKRYINARDVQGNTALHIVVLSNTYYHSSRSGQDVTQRREAEEITEEEEPGHHNMVTRLLREGALVDVQDHRGQTPLHAAVRAGNRAAVRNLITDATSPSNFTQGNISIDENRDKWICMCDFQGETALHAAARVPDKESVSLLLATTKSPDDLLQIRDMTSKTAFDWAVGRQADANEMVIDLEKLRIDSLTSHFLLWHGKDYMQPRVYAHYFSKERKAPSPSSLLNAAIDEQNVNLARELINRGADVTPLSQTSHRWLAEKLGRSGSDRATSEDFLGRNELVQGVSAFLLNPYTQIPVTIGIFGSWGAGKSSFMLQVEKAMMWMVARELSKKTSPSPSLVKTIAMILSCKFTARTRCQVQKALKKMISQSEKMNTRVRTDFLKSDKKVAENSNTKSKRFPQKDEDLVTNSFLPEFLSSRLFKNLALIDGSKLVPSHERAKFRKMARMYEGALQDVGCIAYIPAVLTLHFNAWKYNDKNEASAGLAVEISKNLESFMTPHQWLKMCWRSSWERKPRTIYLQLFFPIFLSLVVLSGFLLLWFLEPTFRKHKTVSIPLAAVSVTLLFFRTFLLVIQPVTKLMLENLKSEDHESMVGYQNQVIEDIKFLKQQLCEDAHFGWVILSILCRPFISQRYCMEGTWISKQHPALDNFRIVVFIDDLDRCDEKTILELLRVINLILGACGINVVIGADKEMVHHAIIHEFLKDDGKTASSIIWKGKESNLKGEKDSLKVGNDKETSSQEDLLTTKDKTRTTKTTPTSLKTTTKTNNATTANDYFHTRKLAENYLQKIIQLPIQIPDPSTKSVEYFLKEQVGQSSRDHKNGELQKSEQARGLPSEQDESTHGGNPAAQDATVDETQEESLMDDANPQNEEHGNNIENRQQMNYKERILIEDGTIDSNAFQLLLGNYTPNIDIDLLTNLCQLATKEKKVPREWKRFLSYHRLAWTILRQDKSMKDIEFSGWQRKFFLWIFLCWNWRYEMDVIFEDWSSLLSKTSKKKSFKNSTKNYQASSASLQLSNIIATYAHNNNWNVEEKMADEDEQGDDKTPKAWKDLYTTLTEEYDIPLHFVDKFQQFRFYCLFNHLEVST